MAEEETVINLEDEDLETGSEPAERVDPREAQNNLTEKHPRFQEVYREKKELSRKLEDLEKKMEGMSKNDERYSALLDHNKQLTEAIEHLASSQETGKQVDQVKELKDEFADLKVQRSEARENLDWKSLDKIEDRMDFLKSEIKRAEDLSKHIEVAKNTYTPTQDEVDELAKLHDDFSWYETDEVATAAVQALDIKLKKISDWKHRSNTERWREAFNQINEKFGFNTSTPRTAANNSVDGGRMRGAGVKGNTVTLSAEEKSFADNLGISHKDYAIQKQLMSKGGK